ncbi:MAG: hypothetical protein ABIA77_01570 [Candidatus Omnitrophota bacterium]
MKNFLVFLIVFGICGMFTSAYAEGETVLFGFEKGLDGWEIPDWAFDKGDHVQKEVSVSSEYADQGTKSLKIDAEFPGDRWAGAIVEIMQYFDWTEYNTIACDVYIPVDAPLGLKAKMILTVGDTWKWVEMSKSAALKPGEWVVISADLMPGSIDWRRVQVDDVFRQDVRKLDIRIESNNKPAYTGPIYVDNIRLIK